MITTERQLPNMRLDMVLARASKMSDSQKPGGLRQLSYDSHDRPSAGVLRR